MGRLGFLKIALVGALVATAMAGTAYAQDVTVGLITKTETNPFFVKMREGAEAKAKELGIELRTAAGKYDGDNDGQVAAIENLISAGAYEALKAVGKDDGSVLIVSVDGGCPGVANVKSGVIGATSQQYPLKMASMALDAIVSGTIPVSYTHLTLPTILLV